jgi:hypothetical protein
MISIRNPSAGYRKKPAVLQPRSGGQPLPSGETNLHRRGIEWQPSWPMRENLQTCGPMNAEERKSPGTSIFIKPPDQDQKGTVLFTEYFNR